jgi:glucosylceramidase
MRIRTSWRAERLAAATAFAAGLACAVPTAAAAPGSQRFGRTAAAGRVAAVKRPVVAVTETTADLRQALSREPSLRFRYATPGGAPLIQIGSRPLQRYIGVGGAMTDSAAYLIENELTAPMRATLLARLFGHRPGDIGLRFVRVPIGASDFTATGAPYTYDDLAPGHTDPRMRRFSIAHDRAYILPALRSASVLNRRLYVEGVPWTAPAWMKANDQLDNLGDGGALQRHDDGPFARYLVRFVRAYERDGVHVDALAPANEPVAKTSYPGMYLPSPLEAQFVRRQLRPALRSAKLSPALLGWDLSWGRLPESSPLAQATHAARGPAPLTGIAWHCYYGNPTAMTALHAVSPRALQIVDECATGSGDPWPTSELQIASFRNWAGAVALWNLALDPAGGPVQPPNEGCQGCTGIVTVDPLTHTFWLSPDFYELGQVSRFVAPGARRLASTHFVSYGDSPSRVPTVTAGLDDVVFRNPGGGLVLIAYNDSAEPLRFAIRWHRRYARATIPAGATMTLRWR